MNSQKKEEKIKENKIEESCDVQNESDCQCEKDKDCKCDECNNECADDNHCASDIDDSIDDVDEGESEEMLILKNTIQNLEEKVRYHQAELINYRKRKDEEVSNMLKFANQDLIVEILQIVDNFERAIKLGEKDETNAKFIEGFHMIYNNLLNTLHKFGVEEIQSTGEKFDPNYHEALLIAEDKEKEDGIILETLVTGYTLKGKVIRHSSVKVNKLN